ncbi:hypothetical protein [Haloferula sp.]|uniref:hypothetical protein n=1 Tax=Haloferula sp. TaxID=2497595 RepID=UPI00329F5E88
MSTKVILDLLKETKVADLAGVPEEDLSTDLAVMKLAALAAKGSEESLTVLWQLKPRGWTQAKRKWKLSSFSNLTLGEALARLTETEGWNYRIREGSILIQQFH